MPVPVGNCIKLFQFFIFPVCQALYAGQSAESEELKIYWTVRQDTVIRRANLDGLEREDVVQTAGGFVQNLAVDPIERKLYWVSPEAEGVQRSNYDGTNVESVVTRFGEPTHVAIDHIKRKLYWADVKGETSIWRSDLNGTNRVQLTNVGGASFSTLEIDPIHQYIYWSERNRGTIRRARTHGDSQVETIFDEFVLNTGGNLDGLALDPSNGLIYATDFARHSIVRMELDGSNPSLWITNGVSNPVGILVDMINERVIWSNAARSPKMPEDTNISSVKFDGSDQRVEFVPNWRAGPDSAGRVQGLEIIDISIPEPPSASMLIPCALMALLSMFRPVRDI